MYLAGVVCLKTNKQTATIEILLLFIMLPHLSNVCRLELMNCLHVTLSTATGCGVETGWFKCVQLPLNDDNHSHNNNHKNKIIIIVNIFIIIIIIITFFKAPTRSALGASQNGE